MGYIPADQNLHSFHSDIKLERDEEVVDILLEMMMLMMMNQTLMMTIQVLMTRMWMMMRRKRMMEAYSNRQVEGRGGSGGKIELKKREV